MVQFWTIRSKIEQYRISKLEMGKFRDITDFQGRRDDVLNFIKGDAPLSLVFDLPTEIPNARVELYRTLYSGVGNSRTHSVPLPNGGTAHLKLECNNSMGGSHYARFWLPYLFIAETLGMIVPGNSRLLEVTSGSSGIALAMAAQKLGYQLTIITPDVLPEVRIAPMLAANAEVVPVKGYILECQSLLRRMLGTRLYFAPNHSEELSDLLIHSMRRISLEYQSEYGTPDHAYAALGNGCSTIGLLLPYKESLSIDARWVYWPADDFDRLVFGMFLSPIELKHVPQAISLGRNYRISGSIETIQQEVFRSIDLDGLQPGWSTLLGLSAAMDVDRQEPEKTHFLVCYDNIGRY